MINEKIKLMDLSRPKNSILCKVHGRTKIELFDGLTGKLKERIEESNMFTSAIDQMVNFALKHNYTSSNQNLRSNGLTRILNNHLNLVSGLLLFSTALDADEDNIWAPASAKLTGCGATDYTNIDANVPIMGAYNSAESQSDTLMRSWVWDFQTSQANGTIATACLTNRIGGKVGYGYSGQMGTDMPFGYIYGWLGLGNIIDGSRYGRYTPSIYRGCVPLNGSYLDFCIDSENDLKYMYSVQGAELRILSHKMSPENFDLFRSARAIQPATVETYAGNFSSAYYYHFYNTDEKALYIWGYSRETLSASNFTLTVHRFDMESKTLTMNYDSVTVPNNITIYLNSVAITANGIYAYGSSNYSVVYKHTRGGGSGFSTIQIASSVNSVSGQNDGAYILNNVLYMPGAVQFTSSSNSRREIMVNLLDDSILFRPWSQTLSTQSSSSEDNCIIVPPYSNKQLVFGLSVTSGSVLNTTSTTSLELISGDCAINTFTQFNYLATKNVLSTPVVKTSDKTMKVTYTITGEELE